jgi:hypothetical protein
LAHTTLSLIGIATIEVVSTNFDTSHFNIFTAPHAVRAGPGLNSSYSAIFALVALLDVILAPFYFGLLFRHHATLVAVALVVCVPVLILSGVPESESGATFLALMLLASLRSVWRSELRLRGSFLDKLLVEEQQTRTRRMLLAMLPASIADHMVKQEGGDGDSEGDAGEGDKNELGFSSRGALAFARLAATEMREAAAFVQDSLARLVLFSILGFDYPSAGEVAETRARLRELRADATATEVAATAAAGPGAAADGSGVKPQSQQLLQDQADSTGKLAVMVASPTQASSSFSHASASFGALGSAPGSAELVHIPRPIAPASRASTYEVSLLLFDLVGFTSLSADVGPSRIVELLDDMYASFDRIVAHRGVRKIETIGDAFLVACGAPEPVDLVVSSATIA